MCHMWLIKIVVIIKKKKKEIETESHSRTLSIVVFLGGLQASIAITRNLMHADSFLFISRVAASKNHTFFNHFLCLTIKQLPRIFAYPNNSSLHDVLFLRHAPYLDTFGLVGD